MLIFKLVSGVTISVFVKSMEPSPGWGLGNVAPAPAGTTAVGAAAVTEAPLGITTVLVAPAVSCLSAVLWGTVLASTRALVVVGSTAVLGMASWSKHFTSSADARSSGV